MGAWRVQWLCVVIGLVALGPQVGGARPAGAQEADETAAERARLQRQGAGVRVSFWAPQGLEELEGVDYSSLPLFEGYFQRGLDLHLAIESSIALWYRSQEVTSSGLGGSSREEIRSYIVPLFTAIRFFATRPGAPVEPYLAAGAGFAIGIDDRETTGGGLLGGSGGTAFATGFGFKGGAGVEVRLGRALALDLAGRYLWIRFGQEVGRERTFAGPGLDVGVSYRFQY